MLVLLAGSLNIHRIRMATSILLLHTCDVLLVEANLELPFENSAICRGVIVVLVWFFNMQISMRFCFRCANAPYSTKHPVRFEALCLSDIHAVLRLLVWPRHKAEVGHLKLRIVRIFFL